ncbi:hypothetical protein, variant [Blastomyces dermatitidis ATCC 26199]|nr:hypothetical protein BDFG_03349 [Blastomyces dermatitidis ATCC 26199]EQL34914.1 hypothetical protein, variant [Blastomyces dermatitidis ATCC 26199]
MLLAYLGRHRQRSRRRAIWTKIKSPSRTCWARLLPTALNSQRDAEAESLVQIVAGSDTTATTLRIALLLLTTSPKTYTTLASEIDRAISQSRISSPVTDAEARALPYLQACIKECFRFWPPITGIMPRICPREAMVCEVFGGDAEVFSPGRWLERREFSQDESNGEREAERVNRMERTVELVFGQGKWGCLGKPISLPEINKVLVELLRRFDFAILNPAHPMDTFNYGVSVQKKFVYEDITADRYPKRGLVKMFRCGHD